MDVDNIATFAKLKLATIGKSEPLSEQSRDQIEIDLLAEKVAHLRLVRQQRLRFEIYVGILLVIQVIGLFMLALFQGLGKVPWTDWTFGLEEWAFGILTTGTLLNTFMLAKQMAGDLFPGNHGNGHAIKAGRNDPTI